jgi:hypothetical protein
MTDAARIHKRHDANSERFPLRDHDEEKAKNRYEKIAFPDCSKRGDWEYTGWWPEGKMG